MYHNRPLTLGGATAVVENNVVISAAEGRRLYVANLPYTATEAELIDFFGGFSM
jgi:RNA recognition motif-containing protein